ncbi:Type 1 glutamine amidotransferase-like domain-containing protein [Dehalococcoidia bacterium]|nr:Type 1 glutamine amidotransferase-like domain-containing protein [Dehalococcoidia bacterium]
MSKTELNNIFLVGGDEFSEKCVSMDTWALNRTKNSKPVVAIVPTAAAHESPNRAAENGSIHFQKLGAETIETMILSRKDAHDQSRLSELDQADLIYFTGGNPQHLLETIRGTATEITLRAASAKGTILAGSSAGAMIMGSQMRYRRWIDSLGICENLTILPHHENSSPEVVIKDCSAELSKGLSIIGVDGATGVFISNGEAHVLGTGIVTKYSQRGFLKFKSGEQFQL